MEEKEKNRIIEELYKIPKIKLLDYFEDKIRRFEFLIDGDISYDIFFDDSADTSINGEMFTIKLGFKVNLNPEQAKDAIEKLESFRMGE